jgi:hypothetical protein
MKTLMTAAALAALLAATPSLADDRAPVDQPAATEAAPAENATSPATQGNDAATEKSQDQVLTTPAQKGPAFLSTQNEGQWLASNLIGSTVQNPAGESLGDINDVLVSGEGPVQAVVIGVGGFLGIGEKNVAVAFDRIERTTGEDGKPLFVLNATKEELDQAPPFMTLAELRQQQDADKPAPADTGMRSEPVPTN